MAEESEVRYLSQNEFNKIRIYSMRMVELMERDGTIEQFRGSTDYLIRTAIEALGLSLLFYDPLMPQDDVDNQPVSAPEDPLDWERAKKYLTLVKHRYEDLRNIPVEIVQIRPGDRIIVSVHHGVSITREGFERMRELLRPIFPDNEIVLIQGCVIKVVRHDGGEEAEADGVEGAGGESGKAETE